MQDEAHLCAFVGLAALAGGDAVQHRAVHAQLALAQVVDVLVHAVLGDQAVDLRRGGGVPRMLSSACWVELAGRGVGV